MSSAVVVLLVIQCVLLAALVAVAAAGLVSVRASLLQAALLMAKMNATLENDVTPVLLAAKGALTHTEEAATIAAQTLQNAAPAVSTASQVAQVFQRTNGGLWLDGARLAMGLIGVVRDKRKRANTASNEGESGDARK